MTKKFSKKPAPTTKKAPAAAAPASNPTKKKAPAAAAPASKEALPIPQPAEQVAVGGALLPGAYLLPWMVQLAGGINSTAYVLAWLLGVRVAASGPALAFHRSVGGTINIAIKKARLGELLGLTEGAVKEATKHLCELGLIDAKLREDDGKKMTFFSIDLDAVRAAKAKVCADEGVTT